MSKKQTIEKSESQHNPFYFGKNLIEYGLTLFTIGEHAIQLVPQMAKIAKECEEEAYAIFRKAAEQEKDWAEFLFKDGSMIGLNKDILCQYVEYITNIRMQTLGMKPIFSTTQNPIPWINAWLVSDNVQVAPQESEISSYLVGQIDNEVDGGDFGDFDL